MWLCNPLCAYLWSKAKDSEFGKLCHICHNQGKQPAAPSQLFELL